MIVVVVFIYRKPGMRPTMLHTFRAVPLIAAGKVQLDVGHLPSDEIA